MASTGPTSTPCTTPDYTGCTYQSITLNAGDQFILPPGTQLVSVSDINNITSTDNCLDTSNLEELTCYVARIVGFNQSDGVGSWFETIPTEYNRLVGYSLNGESVITGSWDYNSFDGGFLDDMVSRIPGIVDHNHFYTYDGSSVNDYWSYQIKTFPSIAENLEILQQVKAENFLEDGGGDPLPVYYRVKFEPRATADSRGLPASLC